MSDEIKESKEVDYSLANPDTLTKYKTAAEITNKCLASVTGLVVDGASVLSICEEGDKLLEEEIAKVYKGKNITKGISFPTTIAPNDILTPLSPISTDPLTESLVIKTGDIVKIELGAHIDGFAAIVGTTIVVGDAEITGPKADLLLATHYCREAFLRLILPPAPATEAEDDKPATPAAKPATASKINSVLAKIASSYGCTVVESTTAYCIERNEMEGKKRIVLNPGEGQKGEGFPEVGEAWGVEVQLSLGSGKVKVLQHKPTLYRKTTTTFDLKRQSSRQTLTEVSKRFGTFPFSSRQLSNAKTSSFGLIECTRGNVLRQYEVLGEKDGSATSREYSVVVITKKGLTVITSPSSIDTEKIKSDKKIEDEEILKLLETPLGPAKKANKKKKKASGEE